MVKLGQFFPKEMQQLEDTTPALRFDVFKGHLGKDGRIEKVRSVGQARLYPGHVTYIIEVKTLLGMKFYMLPDRSSGAPEGQENGTGQDYRLLTRQEAVNAGRKFFWNHIGDAARVAAPNDHLLRLTWDLFHAPDIFLNLDPLPSANKPQAETTAPGSPQVA